MSDNVQIQDVIRPSKSERKREMQALQVLAERLIRLNPQQWQPFDFSSAMLEALDETRRRVQNDTLGHRGRKTEEEY